MNKKIFFYIFALSTVLPLTFLYSLAQNINTQNNFNPKPASASVYNLGLKSYEKGDLDSAISFFKRAVELDPDFVDAYFNLGAIYKRQGKLTNAIGAFQKSVELTPTDYEAVFELANCYLEEKKYESAKKYFSQIPANFPRYNEAKQNIEKTNRYIAVEIGTKSGQADIIKSPEVQAQLLADTLQKEIEKSEQQVVQEPSLPAENKGQALAKSLTQPTIKAKSRIVTNNFSGPTGITKDSKNFIYIANFTKDSIERVTTDGQKELFLEKKGIDGPVGLATDENDNLYIANFNGDSILKVTPNKEISVLVSNIIRPYYLFYDRYSNKLFATAQGNNSLIEIDTYSASPNNPLTYR